jgi:hypothetical protein
MSVEKDKNFDNEFNYRLDAAGVTGSLDVVTRVDAERYTMVDNQCHQRNTKPRQVKIAR